MIKLTGFILINKIQLSAGLFIGQLILSRMNLNMGVPSLYLAVLLQQFQNKAPVGFKANTQTLGTVLFQPVY